MVVFDGVHIEAATSMATTRYQQMWECWPSSIFGLPLLGHGVSKAAYALPNGAHVLKIGAPDVGMSQITNEIKVWCHAPSELKRHLAAIVEFGENWIIAERANPLTLWEDETEIYEFCLQFTGGHIGRWSIPDVLGNRNNVGRRVSDSSLCVVDYGCGYGAADYRDW